ncbi:hypothetical protein Tco_0367810 [Tanacetum coccineum]
MFDRGIAKEIRDMREVNDNNHAYVMTSNDNNLAKEIRDMLMDDPNISMEEYIRLEEEKSQKCGKVFNWETAKYGKIWYDEDIHYLRSFETEFPAIAFNDGVSSKTLSCEPTALVTGHTYQS